MRKKIFLGSIGVVVIIILASLATVVGLQSPQTKSMNNSPLFEYRTKKAIQKTWDMYQRQYIGKNNALNIPLSAPDQQVQFVIRFLQCIIQMDDTTFNALLTYCITHILRDNKLQSINIAQIITGLKSIRKDPEHLIDQIVNNSDMMNNRYDTKQSYTIGADWTPGCMLKFIIEVIFDVLVIYPLFLILFFITSMNDCLQSIGTNENCCPCFRIQVSKYLSDFERI